ncbi:hypothetical protein B5C08_09995, partial [Staphylococcus delphini]
TTLTKPYNHIHHNTLFKKVKIGRSSSVMSFLINTPLTNRRKGSGLFLILPGVKKGGYLGESLFS